MKNYLNFETEIKELETELDKLKDFIEDAFKDEELMSKTKRASAMDYSIRGKESGKKFGNKKASKRLLIKKAS